MEPLTAMVGLVVILCMIIGYLVVFRSHTPATPSAHLAASLSLSCLPQPILLLSYRCA